MRYETYALNLGQTDNSDGTARDVRELRDLTVSVTGGSGYTLKIQGRTSSDDAWVEIASVAAASLNAIATSGGAPLALSDIRIHTTTAGTLPTVTLAGRNTRTDS